MLNLWLIALLASGILGGFFFLDNFFAKHLRALRKVRKLALITKILQALSLTPFIVVLLYCIPALLAWWKIDFYSSVALTTSCALSLGISFLGKYIFGRNRPFGNLTYLGEIDSSFPSAHTAGSFAAAFTLAVFWPPLSVAVFILAGLVAFSRMYLEFHFFSDVMGGILLAHLLSAFVLNSDFLLFLGFA